jgi:hypothetical protein
MSEVEAHRLLTEHAGGASYRELARRHGYYHEWIRRLVGRDGRDRRRAPSLGASRDP